MDPHFIFSSFVAARVPMDLQGASGCSTIWHVDSVMSLAHACCADLSHSAEHIRLLFSLHFGRHGSLTLHADSVFVYAYCLH